MTILETVPAERGVARRPTPVAVLGIGTATPPSITQAEATRLAEAFACTSESQTAWLRRVFSRCGVGHRGTVLETVAGGATAFYGPPSVAGERGPSTAVRMARYAADAPVLMERSARGALEASGVEAGEITHIITVSCTGFFAPGLDVELITRLGLKPSVRRTHIGFMGCHAAFNALGAAQDAVRADPAAVVLVCCVELSTLHFAYGWQPEKLVANALFADGAAACVVAGVEREAEGSGKGWRLLTTASLLLPESREAMTWRIGDHGFEMTLSSELPALIGKHIRPWCEGWLGEMGVGLGEVEHWAIHPGGPRILSAAGGALGVSEAGLAASYGVLAVHGNMSSATVLFVLKRLAAEAGGAGEACVAIGFGPGLMAEGMLLESSGGGA